MARGKVGTELFEVSEFPEWPKAERGPRESQIAKDMASVAEESAGRVVCVRQYENRGSAEGRATDLRKKYPGWVVKVGPLADGRVGVFVQAPF